MGTWIGHIAPGGFFVIFALWWHVNNCIRYLKSLADEKNGKPKEQRYKFQGSTTYPCNCLPACQQIPLESILKILITSIHFSIELITGYYPKPTPHLGEENAHHTAMLFGFFLGAWIEILIYYKIPLPNRLAHVMGFLAFAIEGLMMVFHLHARSLIDAHIHQLLGLTITCSMIGALGECFNPNNFWFIVGRSFFALTQGTWFIQAAYVIWPTTTNPLFIWDPESHRSVSLLTMSYAYHLAGNAFILIIIYLFILRIMSSRLKLNIDELEDEENNSDYKLILKDDLLLNGLEFPSYIYVPLDKSYLLECNSENVVYWKLYLNNGNIEIVNDKLIRLNEFDKNRDGFYQCYTNDNSLKSRSVFIFSNGARFIDRNWTELKEFHDNLLTICRPMYFNYGFNEQFIELIDNKQTVRYNRSALLVKHIQSTTHLFCKLYIDTTCVGIRVKTLIKKNLGSPLLSDKYLKSNDYLEMNTNERDVYYIAFEGDSMYFHCPSKTVGSVQWHFLSFNYYLIIVQLFMMNETL